MSKRSRKVHPVHRLARCAIHTAQLAFGFVRRQLAWPSRLPIEVVTTDRHRRHHISREVRRSVRRLRKLLGELMPRDIMVVVQHVIPADQPAEQLGGCCQIVQHSSGRRLAVIRLALQVRGRRLTTDEVLAALTEQCLGLAIQHGDSVSITVPIRLDTEAPAHQAPTQPTQFRPGPFDIPGKQPEAA